MEMSKMKRASRLRMLSALLVLAVGCATASSTPIGAQPGSDAVLASPELLRERYQSAVERRKPDLAYAYLSLIHLLHPTSPEDREVFPMAAKQFKQNFYLHRGKSPGSVWALSEPVFMIQWILEIEARSETFPEEEFVYLFRAMPIDFYEQFASYAKPRGVYRRWDIQVTDDNGRIESIRATPAATTDASTAR
jgi:hypothetical protein